MSPIVSFWTDAVPRTLTALATTVVAIYVALISKRQLRNNQEKLRLDLYQRRFEIYARVLEYYWALTDWQDKPEQFAARGPFVRAFCESKFMFPEESGVYALLKKFNEHASRISNHTSTLAELGEAYPRERGEIGQKRIESAHWILGSLDTLIERMAPFLNFHSL